MPKRYEAQSERYIFLRGTVYSESQQSDSQLYGNLDCIIKRVFLKYEGDSLEGGYGERADSSDLGKLEDIAKKAGIQSPSKFLHEYDDGQLNEIASRPVEVDNVDEPEVYLPIEELIELRDFEKRLEQTIPDYRKPEPLRIG